MIITLDNICEFLNAQKNPIIKSRVYGTNNFNRYRLVSPLKIQLSTGDVIDIPEGYEWDLASSPRILWSIIVPDSDAEIAFLIHDYIYQYKIMPRKKCDQEMLIWCKKTNDTIRISLMKIDIYLRYWAVRLFGSKAYNN
jgi:hypothetical protein